MKLASKAAPLNEGTIHSAHGLNPAGYCTWLPYEAMFILVAIWSHVHLFAIEAGCRPPCTTYQLLILTIQTL